MITFIDNLLNRITMYRLVQYFLIFILALAVIFGNFGLLPYSPIALIFSTFLLIFVCWCTNRFFAWAFNAQTNTESANITALILALIISPAAFSQHSQIFFLVWAGVFAMASKYILAINKKHIFNPAAIAVVITAFTMGYSATWWACGNLILVPFIIIGGLLITRKIQRFDLVISFLVVALTTIVLTAGSLVDPFTTIQKALQHAPVFFFAFVMLTEPLTTPPTRMDRIIVGAFTGFLFAPNIHLGSIYSTPELALVVGNVVSYALSPKEKYVLPLAEKTEVGTDIYNFTFKIDKPMKFQAGQYLEFTLSHSEPDSRGNRRYFTIASSPTENNLQLGVKFYEKQSSFKKKMLSMKTGDSIIAGSLAGDFTLPKDSQRKLAFIAGGIGITPFRSMVKYLSDTKDPRSVVMLYSNRTPDEIAYRDVFDEAEKTIGMKTIYAITNEKAEAPATLGHKGRIDADLIRREVPDYHERIFYISGTHGMVVTFRKILKELKVPASQIKTDFFPGFV